MQFIDIPTEQTTAITDAILAVLAVGCMWYLWRIGRHNRWKTGVWMAAFGLLALGAALGAIAHGFKMSPRVNNLFWQPLYLSLGLTVAMFVVGVIYDVWGRRASRRSLWPMLIVGLAFYGVTRLFPGTFRVFIVYEALAMLFALAVYLWLVWKKRLTGAGLIALGILVMIIAAAVQATKTLSVTLIWPFDYNGLYHLIQMAGVLLLFAGLRSALLSEEPSS